MHDEKTLDNNFTYHAPKGTQQKRYEEIRDHGKAFARVVFNLCPESAEATTALRRIEEAVMWANAAIARNE